MPHVVGLLSHTGRVGSITFKHLLKAHEEKKIVLVILHRPESNISSVPSDIETRVVDLANPDHDQILAAVKGLHTLVSLVSYFALIPQVHLFEPLSKTPGFVTYINPSLGNPAWTTDEEPTDPRIATFLGETRNLVNVPRQLGFGSTRLQCGIFADYFFNHKYVGTDLEGNAALVPTGGETKGVPIISTQAIAEAVAELALRDPESIKNKFFHAFDYYPTGNQIVETLTQLNGSPPKVTEVTEDDIEARLNAGGLGVAPAVYLRTWASGDWGWKGERLGVRDQDFTKFAERYFKKK